VARLATGVRVAALLRRVAADGGAGAVIARGDPTAGALLVQLADRGVDGDLVERVLDARGAYRWQPVGPAAADRPDWLARRRRTDPDLWVVELDHPQAAGLLSED